MFFKFLSENISSFSAKFLFSKWYFPTWTSPTNFVDSSQPMLEQAGKWEQHVKAVSN